VLVVDPRTVLVLGLDLHGLQALSDKVLVLPALVAHARAPPSVLSVRVHALELPTQQCEIFLTQHIELLILHGHKTREKRTHYKVSPLLQHNS
jgi:hypothetical protein